MGIEMKPYYRPLSLESYAYLVKKAGNKAKILAGGGYIMDAAETKRGTVLIDLQALPLDKVRFDGETVSVGGLCNLSMLALASQGIPELRRVIQHQAGLNVRNTLSLANFLRSLSVGQSSPLFTALLALDARIVPLLEQESLALDSFIGKETDLPLISELLLPQNSPFVYAQVARSELDLPQVNMGITLEKDGALRVAIEAGKRFVLKGNAGEIEAKLKDLSSDLADEWASAEFRQEVLLTLFRRLVDELETGRKETK